MLGLNGEDAAKALEDTFIVSAIAQGAADNVKARRLEKEATLLRQCAVRIREQSAVILQQNELIASLRKELDSLHEKNADNIAVANATALTLKVAVDELRATTDEPEMKADQLLRRVRTRNYNDQVNGFMAAGHLRTDPRTSDVIAKRKWYVPGMDPEHNA